MGLQTHPFHFRITVLQLCHPERGRRLLQQCFEDFPSQSLKTHPNFDFADAPLVQWEDCTEDQDASIIGDLNDGKTPRSAELRAVELRSLTITHSEESGWPIIREPKTGSNKWCLRRIRAHQGTSRCINCVLLYRGCFCKNDMHTHAHTSLDQLVRNADQLVTAKKRMEGVHHGTSVAHHDSPYIPFVLYLFRFLEIRTCRRSETVRNGATVRVLGRSFFMKRNRHLLAQSRSSCVQAAMPELRKTSGAQRSSCLLS